MPRSSKTATKKRKHLSNNISLSSSKPTQQHADTVIVGGGLAGLYLALRLKLGEKNRSQRKHPQRIVILEASDRCGGRIHTIRRPIDNDQQYVQYEAGAARFNSDRHQRVWKLLHELELSNHIIPITGDVTTVGVPDDEQLDVHQVITKLDIKGVPRTRAVTLLDIIREQQGADIAERVERNYFYYAELGQLAWWDAYQLFTRDFAPSQQYYALGGRGGLSQLPQALFKKCKAVGVEVYLDARVSQRSGNVLELIDGKQWLARERIIYACPADAVHLFDPKIGKRMLDNVQPTPLYRIYAGGYPTNTTHESISTSANSSDTTGNSSDSRQDVWFAKMGKMSVAVPKQTPLKFVIPISDSTISDPKESCIMISYTDSKYANAMYNALDAGTNNKQLLDMVKQAFPHIRPRSALKPSWVAHHYWPSGAGFWRPGVHSTRAIRHISGPYPATNSVKIWLAGENLSHFQGWMEGALESAEYILSRLGYRSNIMYHHTRRTKKGGSRKSKTITRKELSRHNKRTDAWLAINGQVYDVTSWVNKHPGGDIIMKGVGKDATKMFNSIRGGSGHPDYVNKKILPRYLIGKLVK